MKELLITLLETFGFPVILQGTLTEEEPYPESFFTIWNNDTFDQEFYDNEERETVWDFDVNFYASDPALVNSKLVEAKQLLKENGFIVRGKGYDVFSDEPTHTGRGMNALKIEK